MSSSLATQTNLPIDKMRMMMSVENKLRMFERAGIMSASEIKPEARGGGDASHVLFLQNGQSLVGNLLERPTMDFPVVVFEQKPNQPQQTWRTVTIDIEAVDAIAPDWATIQRLKSA